jgi:hypothetical protein
MELLPTAFKGLQAAIFGRWGEADLAWPAPSAPPGSAPTTSTSWGRPRPRRRPSPVRRVLELPLAIPPWER